MVNLNFRLTTFVEAQNDEGYWVEQNIDSGFLDGYSSLLDGYITAELFASLSTLPDGYANPLFRKGFPNKVSNTITYKLHMLSKLTTFSTFNVQKVYWFKLSELLGFNWNAQVPGSEVLGGKTYQQVGADFVTYFIPSLQNLGEPDKVRMFVLKY